MFFSWLKPLSLLLMRENLVELQAIISGYYTQVLTILYFFAGNVAKNAKDNHVWKRYFGC